MLMKEINRDMKLFKKWENPNPSLKSHFDYLIEYGFAKTYTSINGEEEIVFKNGTNSIEIYHNYGKRKVVIEVIVSCYEGRMNLGELFLGVRQPFYSITDTKQHIERYLQRYA